MPYQVQLISRTTIVITDSEAKLETMKTNDYKKSETTLFSVIFTFSSPSLWAYKSVYFSGGRCPTPGCDGSGHLTSNFASHRRCDFLFSWWILSLFLFIVFSLPRLCCQTPVGRMSLSLLFVCPLTIGYLTSRNKGIMKKEQTRFIKGYRHAKFEAKPWDKIISRWAVSKAV